MKNIKKIKLYINNNEKSLIVAKDLELTLKKYGFLIVDNKPDLAISIGGDGSFLRMVKENKFNSKIFYIGINAGTLGFLQEIDINRTNDFVKKLSTNSFKIEELSILETKIITEEKIYKFNSLNEIVVRQRELNTLKMPIYIDKELLEHYTGDGILISTSTGSTAYNMSFGGPIIYNTLNTLTITPIAPINNSSYRNLFNPIIVPSNKLIELKPQSDILVMIDGVNKTFKDCINIESKIGNKKIKCIRMSDFHFVKVVNKKLLKK